jgi:U4/U6.U5 tri-snRNP-associated protein 2
MIQAISVASKKKYHPGKQAAAAEFLSWFLHQLHIGVGGSAKKSSIVQDTFQGVVEVTVRQPRKKTKSIRESNVESDEEADSQAPMEENMPHEQHHSEDDGGVVMEETTKSTNFMHLTLDIPEKPLFKDEDGGLVIPQEPLVSVLKKFDGVTFHDCRKQKQQRSRYRLKKMPKFLILDFARFNKNDFYVEKNPTIIAFPIKNLDLTSYVYPDDENANGVPTEEEIKNMNVSKIM